MIRQAETEKRTVHWTWETDDPTGVTTSLDFRIGVSLGEPDETGARERRVESFEVETVCVQLDVPLRMANAVSFPRGQMRDWQIETFERHGRKAFDESGYLDRLIW